jgi:cob(I)alamin adenosyltransferase
MANRSPKSPPHRNNGTTGPRPRTRVSKDSLRVHAMGDVDELNSSIRCCYAKTCPMAYEELGSRCSTSSSTLGGELSIRVPGC